MDKTLDLRGFVDRLRDGMTIGIGGWGPRRKPMALVREILRSNLKDLTIVTYGGADAGMLCAAGKVRKLIFGFVSLDAIPLEPYFRKAREAGTLDILELDEGMLQWGLKAAAMGLPFLPTRVGFGTDIETHGGFKTVTSPYADGETLIAMPALKLDAALLHVQRADKRGNLQAFGPDIYYDEWFARAAAQTFVSVEEVVDRLEIASPEAARAQFIERMFVTGVIPAPYGAHPTSLPPNYGWDMEHFRRYVASAGEEGGWAKFMVDVIGADEAGYLDRVGGQDRVAALPLPIF
jgi:glutaconate CoA-transferase subunit A